MIRPPIVIDARGNLLAFNSLAAAEKELTPEAVRNGNYPVAYDGDGRLLRIEVLVTERRFLGLFPEVRESVRIIPYEHIPTHEQALRELLLRFIHPRSPSTNQPARLAEDLLRLATVPRP